MALSVGKKIFAVLDDEEVDNLPQQLANPPRIKNGATSLRVSKNKKQLQKQAEKKEQLKNKKQAALCNPEVLRAKPLILPDHVLAQQKVLRRPKPKPNATTANGQGKADDQKKNIEVTKPQLPQNLTLKEYEEGLLENKKDAQRKQDDQERTSNLAKGFESMKLIGNKKEDNLSIKKNENIGKKSNKMNYGKNVVGKKDKKFIAINESFIKPVNGHCPSANNAHIKSTPATKGKSIEEAPTTISFGDFDQMPALQNRRCKKGLIVISSFQLLLVSVLTFFLVAFVLGKNY